MFWLYGPLSAKWCLCFLIWVYHSFSSKEQVSFNSGAAVTVCGDCEAPEKKPVMFPFFPHLFSMKWWERRPWSSFFECGVLSQLFHSPLSRLSRSSLVPLRFQPLEWYHLHIWGYWYFSWHPDSSLWFIQHDVLCILLLSFSHSIVSNSLWPHGL